jgi:hypothetical protein
MSRTAGTLQAGDRIGWHTIKAVKRIEAVCHPRKGATPEAAVVITWTNGYTNTLAVGVRVADAA